MYLTIQSETFRQMGNLQRTCDAAFPRNISTHDVCRLLADDLCHSPMAAPCGLRGCDGYVESLAQLRILIKFEIPERFLQPDIVQTLQLTPHFDCLVEGILSHRVAHQSEVVAHCLSQILVYAHVGLNGSWWMHLVAFDAPLLIIKRFVDIFLFRGVEQTAGIDRQLFAIGTHVLV